MKRMMFAALAIAIATPALAQTMPAPVPAQDPAMAQPAAPTTTPAANMSAATPVAPMAATGPYPMCSRTVTDQCTERSNARGERLHSSPRPHKH
ncbi:hypothetical protein [Sphingomonas sp.]|uniref:hypothetical protein n=1 Tax=Sphingomonas sp. TaxID=28214 RepID=UPI0033401E3A